MLLKQICVEDTVIDAVRVRLESILVLLLECLPACFC